MEQKYKNDNALLEYVDGIVALKRILNDLKVENKQSRSLLYSLLYCNAITVFQTFIGETIRYKQYKENGHTKEEQAYQNPQVIEKSLKIIFGIQYSLSDEYKEALFKKTYVNSSKWN